MKRLDELLIKPKPKSKTTFKYYTGELKQEDTFVVDKRQNLLKQDIDTMLDLISKI